MPCLSAKQVRLVATQIRDRHSDIRIAHALHRKLGEQSRCFEVDRVGFAQQRINLLAPLKLHYLRWVLFDDDTRFMYQGIFDTDFDKYTEDAIALFKRAGVDTVFENLEDFPADWKTNPGAFIRFVRKHQCPSFIEYGEYPYVTADEIKKALKLKEAFSAMLEQMQ